MMKWSRSQPAALRPQDIGYCAGADSVEEIASAAPNFISSITTGGGFSKLYSAPSWQRAAVAAYLASGARLPGAGNFNSAGRGYPDVAAIGCTLVIWLDGDPMLLDGTSASAPVFAAILALANSALHAQGLPPVGFVNPTIYAIAAATPAAFRDVNCTGCDTSCGRRSHGW
jgi:tripeptidyl-peptidase-1